MIKDHFLKMFYRLMVEIYIVRLTFTTPWVNSADDTLMIFSHFSKRKGFDISCKLSPVETVCMKFQNLFSGKYKKIFLINFSYS